MTSIHDEIEKEVLKAIKPKPEEYELLYTVFNEIKSVISKILEKQGIDAKITLQGSVAHDTWLSSERDIDVFVLFPIQWSVEELKTRGFELLLEAAKEIGKYEIRYAEHPYVRVFHKGVEADLVPAFNIDSPDQIRTAVDRTPLHTRFINQNLPPELKDDVRLLKKFLKGIGIYGAEIKTKGFSGYLTELLVIVYKGFRNVLFKASKWKHPVYINTLGSQADAKKIFKLLKRKYPDSVLYVPDPIDPRRNVAAAVSIRSLAVFSIASKCYLEYPSKSYFFPQRDIHIEKTVRNAFEENRCIIVLTLQITEKLPPDVLWGELQRIADRAAKVLRNYDFEVIDKGVCSDEKEKALILIEVDECEKQRPRVYMGPEYWSGNRTLSFIKAHLLRNSWGPWIDERGRLVSLGPRKFTSAIDVLRDRAWEYLVTPHFRNTNPLIELIKPETVSSQESEDIRNCVIDFILKRPVWMNACIESKK